MSLVLQQVENVEPQFALQVLINAPEPINGK